MQEKNMGHICPIGRSWVKLCVDDLNSCLIDNSFLCYLGDICFMALTSSTMKQHLNIYQTYSTRPYLIQW